MSADSFTVSLRVPAPPERVWDCLTDPRYLKRWWRDGVSFDARLSGRLSEPWRDADGRERLTEAAVISFHPPFGMVMVWADQDWGFDTVVAILVERDGAGGSRVLIEHQGWALAPAPEREQLFNAHHAGWTAHLASLSAFAASIGGRSLH